MKLTETEISLVLKALTELEGASLERHAIHPRLGHDKRATACRELMRKLRPDLTSLARALGVEWKRVRV